MARWTPRQPDLDYGVEDTLRDLSKLAMNYLSTAKQRAHEKELIDIRAENAKEQAELENQLLTERQTAIANLENKNLKDRNKEQFKRQLALDFPGAVFDDITGTINFDKYTPTTDPVYQRMKAQTLTEIMMDEGLDTSGDMTELESTYKAFTSGRSRGINLASPSIDASVSNFMGGDVTPGILTQQDVRDYESFLAGQNDTQKLQHLVANGFLDSSDLSVDENTGFYIADEKSMRLANSAIMGLKKGVVDNENYLTNLEHEKYVYDDYFTKLDIAEKLVNTPIVQQIQTTYDDLALTTSKLIGAGSTPDGDFTMRFKGKVAKVNDILDAIGDELEGKVDANKIKQFKSFVDNLSTVGAPGSGLINIVETIDDDKIKLLVKIGEIELAKSLKTLSNQWKVLKKNTEATEKFVASPKNIEDVSNFRNFLDITGFPRKMQELRGMEIQGLEDTEGYRELVNTIYTFTKSQNEKIDNQLIELENQLKQPLSPQMKEKIRSDMMQLDDFKVQFNNWIELEDSTNELYKSSVKK